MRIATFGSSNDGSGGAANGDLQGSPYGPSPIGSDGTTTASACSAGAVDVDREVLVRDPRVVDGPDADNTNDSAGVSFRTVFASLAGGEARASAFTQAWLDTWSTRTLDGTGYGPAFTPRPGAASVLVCPWLKQRPENACDATCGTCRERVLDLKKSPFRLMAIATRLDLGLTEGPCGGVGATPEDAELRLVFTATKPGTRDALPFTVIAEYGAGAHSRDDVVRLARTLHEIAALPSGGRYEAALAALLAPYVRGAALKQLRTNEIAFGEASALPWELREFHLAPLPPQADGTTRLAPVLLSRTPDASLEGSPALSAWLRDNANAITSGAAWALPTSFQASAAPTPNADFAWTTTSASALPDGALASFNRATCNGCHGGLALSPQSSFQHLVATATEARPSSFLTQELLRRAAVTSALLCDGADAPPGAPSSPYGTAP